MYVRGCEDGVETIGLGVAKRGDGGVGGCGGTDYTRRCIYAAIFFFLLCSCMSVSVALTHAIIVTDERSPISRTVHGG